MKEDIEKLKLIMEVHSILVFGSHAKGESTWRSDVDVCIVVPEVGKKSKILGKIWEIVGGKYDLWLFEELPLYMKIEIIKNHQILHSKDIPELFEYFYQFRRRWLYEGQRLKKLIAYI